MQEANPSALSRAGGDGDHGDRGNAKSSFKECPLTAPEFALEFALGFALGCICSAGQTKLRYR